MKSCGFFPSVLSTLLWGALVASSLAGCSGDDDNPGSSGQVGSANSSGQGGSGPGGAGTAGAGSAGAPGGGQGGSTGQAGGGEGGTGGGGPAGGNQGGSGGAGGAGEAGGGQGGTGVGGWGGGADPATLLDPDFGDKGIVTVSAPESLFFSIESVASEPSGGLAIVGGRRGAVARLRADGSPDAAFGNNGFATVGDDDLRSTNVAFLPDGKLIVTGYRSGEGADLTQSAVAWRLLPDGSPDLSFGEGGFFTVTLPGGLYPQIYDVKVQGDRPVLLVEAQKVPVVFPNIVVMRLTPGGKLDTTFHEPSGLAIYDVPAPSPGSADLADSLLVRADGSLLALGWGDPPGGGHPSPLGLNDADALSLSLTADGEFDASFGTDGAAYLDHRIPPSSPDDIEAYINTTKGASELPDGGFLTAGITTDALFVVNGYVARYQADGSLETTFGSGGVLAFDDANLENVLDATGLPDGSIVVTGQYVDHATGAQGLLLVRVSPDGQVDPALPPRAMLTGYQGYHLVRQADGKLVVGGLRAGGPGALPDSFVLRLKPL